MFMLYIVLYDIHYVFVLYIILFFLTWSLTEKKKGREAASVVQSDTEATPVDSSIATVIMLWHVFMSSHNSQGNIIMYRTTVVSRRDT